MSDRFAVLRTYPSGAEADVAVAVLTGFGIPAHIRGNDIVGIFGPGFQGPTPQGVDVMVPRELLEEARDLLDSPHDR